MTDVFVVGVGMTPFGRHPNLSVKDLTQIAVEECLKDARCATDAIDVAFYGNTAQGFMDGQNAIRGQVALLPLGIEGIPVHNVENACATASTAFHLAVQQLRAGSADVAIAVGSDKLHSTDKKKMFAYFDGGWDVDDPAHNLKQLTALAEGFELPADLPPDPPHSVFMDVYAAIGRQLMTRHGITKRQMAAVAAKNHLHSVHNDRAQYRTAMTVDEVMAAPSIVYPLTMPMCAPISDGAAAAIVCTREGLERLGLDTSRAVRVRASVIRSARKRDGQALDEHIARRTADAAYEQAGIGPQDVDVVEVHDATAIGELVQIENLRLCEPGQSGALSESGATTIGGRIPINPSGGLESKGHPVGATGLGQIYELVNQLRGECGPRQVEGARIAVQENGGGLWGVEEAVAHVAVFERA